MDRFVMTLSVSGVVEGLVAGRAAGGRTPGQIRAEEEGAWWGDVVLEIIEVVGSLFFVNK